MFRLYNRDGVFLKDCRNRKGVTLEQASKEITLILADRKRDTVVTSKMLKQYEDNFPSMEKVNYDIISAMRHYYSDELVISNLNPSVVKEVWFVKSYRKDTQSPLTACIVYVCMSEKEAKKALKEAVGSYYSDGMYVTTIQNYKLQPSIFSIPVMGGVFAHSGMGCL